MTVLITGGAGFIGSNLCKYLLKMNLKVLCVDNFDKFYSPQIKRNNIVDFQNHPYFALEEIDIRDQKALEALFSRYSIDMVIHLAGKPGVRNSLNKVGKYFEVNVMGTIALLEAMNKYRVKNLVFASSSSVYGNNPNIQNEENCCDKLLSPYACSKRSLELITYNYHINYHFNIIGLRLFSVYGINQRPDLFIYRVFKSIYGNGALEIYGDGQQKRDFTYISDVLNGIKAAVDLCVSVDSIYEIINIGTQNPISISELLRIIKKEVNKHINFTYASRNPGDVLSTFANISKAKRILKYQPTISIVEGIRIINQFYTKNEE